MDSYLEYINRIREQLNYVVKGKEEIIDKVLAAIFAKGHILIEDIPGVGKTTLAMGIANIMDLKYRRLQFTPDVLPSDVVGFSVLNKNGDMEYKPGVILCNLFLADEINRTSSKTQSALLEVMEEGKVTVDGITRLVPKPFTVIATQNPVGSVGTQMLPESQLDRFMIRISMGYPDVYNEIQMLKDRQMKEPLEQIKKLVTSEFILKMQEVTESTYIHDEIYNYIAQLVAATRSNPLIQLGVSPRGTIALTNMSKAVAFMDGRDYVLPQDVSTIFQDVTSHRIILSPKARVNHVTVENILSDILASVQAPTL